MTSRDYDRRDRRDDRDSRSSRRDDDRRDDRYSSRDKERRDSAGSDGVYPSKDRDRYDDRQGDRGDRSRSSRRDDGGEADLIKETYRNFKELLESYQQETGAIASSTRSRSLKEVVEVQL